jgi:transposase
MTVKQMVRLFKEQEVPICETSLRRYLKQAQLLSTVKATIPLMTTPGLQAQVDFGYVGKMIDPITLKKRKAYAFVMTLSHSRYRFVRFVFKQDVTTWIDCHVRAFHFYRGVPRTLLVDNLKAGVIQSDIYDPIINRAYGELERYYGFTVDPAKVRIARHKGKVERSIPLVRQQLIAGRNYRDIHHANEQALLWCKDIIATVVTRSTGETPATRFRSTGITPVTRNAF